MVTPSRRPLLPLDQAETWANRVELAGTLLARSPLRLTPAGMPVVEFSIGHTSSREEAGAKRLVDCEMACVALGVPTALLSGIPLGTALKVIGFLTAKSLKSRAPVLHVNEIEFIEGHENGIQTKDRS